MRDAQLLLGHRLRRLRRLAPFAALATAAAVYGLHHTTALDDHGLSAVALVLVSAAALSAFTVAVSRSAERQLPIFVSTGPAGQAVRPMDAADLDFCAALQRDALTHGFFARLGHRFCRSYLATFVDSPYAVALVATARGVPLGMLVGVTDPGQHARWVLRHRGTALVLLGCQALALRPRVAFTFGRTRLVRYARAWRRASSSESALGPADVRPASLTHVAVVRGTQGMGYGTLLVTAFLETACERGCTRVVLTTIAGEAGAAPFYRRAGWTEAGIVHDFDGRPTIAFTLDLPQEMTS